MKYKYISFYVNQLESLENKSKITQGDLAGLKVKYEGKEGTIRFVTSYSAGGGHGEGSHMEEVYAIAFKDTTIRRLRNKDIVEVL